MTDGFVGAVYNLSVDVMGEKNARKYLPLTGTLALFIFVCNIQGLIPGLIPPTDTLKTNLVFALIVFLVYNVAGVINNGLSYLAHFLGPKIGGFPWLFPLFLPIEIVSHLARPVSLSLRLTGNIVADHKVVAVVAMMIPLLVPLPFLLARHGRRHRPDPRLHAPRHHLHRPRGRARRRTLTSAALLAHDQPSPALRAASRNHQTRNVAKLATFLFVFLVPAIVLAAPAGGAETSGSERVHLRLRHGARHRPRRPRLRHGPGSRRRGRPRGHLPQPELGRQGPRARCSSASPSSSRS